MIWHLTELLETQHGFTHDEASRSTSAFLEAYRSCPDNAQTTLDSWRSYLWSEALPDNYKHLNDKIYKQWLQLRYKYLALTPEYENLLTTLGQQYLLGLITNGPSNAQWEKIHKLNLSHYFDCILVSSDLPWEKPNPNIFLAACNFLSVEAQHCVMIGDKLETDIQGGKEANFGATVWIPINPENAVNGCDAQPAPDLIVQNLCELQKYIPIIGSSRGSAGSHGSGSCGNSSNSSGSSSTSSGSNSHPRRRSQALVTSRKSSNAYRRVASLPEIDLNSDNSSDGS